MPDEQPYEVGDGFYLGDKVEVAPSFEDDPVFVGEISSWFNHPSGEIWVVVRRPFESVPAPLNRLTRI
jgi:hypothetical protein